MAGLSLKFAFGNVVVLLVVVSDAGSTAASSLVTTIIGAVEDIEVDGMVMTVVVECCTAGVVLGSDVVNMG